MRSPPDALDPDAPMMLDALGRLPPRAAQLLGAWVVDGRPAREVAALYGVSEEAATVHLLRSARLMERALASREVVLPTHEASEPLERERVAARRLMEALDARRAERPAAGGADEPARLARTLWMLASRGAEIRRLAEARERAEAESPGGRRREWLRRAALVALVLLAGWLYVRTR